MAAGGEEDVVDVEGNAAELMPLMVEVQTLLNLLPKGTLRPMLLDQPVKPRPGLPRVLLLLPLVLLLPLQRMEKMKNNCVGFVQSPSNTGVYQIVITGPAMSVLYVSEHCTRRWIARSARYVNMALIKRIFIQWRQRLGTSILSHIHGLSGRHFLLLCSGQHPVQGLSVTYLL
jgi:hypothetical protein